MTRAQYITAIQGFDVKHFISVNDLNAASTNDLIALYNAMNTYKPASEL